MSGSVGKTPVAADLLASVFASGQFVDALGLGAEQRVEVAERQAVTGLSGLPITVRAS